MAFKLCSHVHMKSQSTTGTSHFIVSSVAGKATFTSTGNDMNVGDTTFYGAYDASGVWEEGVGTWSSAGGGTLERTTVLASSEGGSSKVSFSDQADVVGGMPATVWNSWADPTLGTGLLARVAANEYETKSIATTVGSLTVTNANGVGGNPTINDSNVIRRSGGAAAQRTMSSPLILGDTDTHVTGFTGGVHQFLNGAENVMQLVRVAANDYTLNLYAGGAPREIVHEDNDGPGSGLDADFVQGHDWSDTHFGEGSGATEKSGVAYWNDNISSPTPLLDEEGEGFLKFPSGILAQFGMRIGDTDVLPNPPEHSFTFPIPFQNGIMFAIPTLNIYSTPTFNMMTHVDSITATGCVVKENWNGSPSLGGIYSVGYCVFGW